MGKSYDITLALDIKKQFLQDHNKEECEVH